MTEARTALIRLRADVLRIATDVDGLADERSIAQVRRMAPIVAERLRAMICKHEYVEASKP